MKNKKDRFAWRETQDFCNQQCSELIDYDWPDKEFHLCSRVVCISSKK